MLSVLRHLLAILLLPFVVAAVIPHWLLTSRSGADTRWANVSPLEWVPRGLGVALFVCGLALFVWCLSLFIRVGRGTLAPWDPTRKLIAVGPYRFVRNPMISGVLAMLAGESLFWGSKQLGLWFVLFVLINQTYFLILEEPGLERRFGESYLTYKANVPRWIPRLKPWEG